MGRIIRVLWLLLYRRSTCTPWNTLAWVFGGTVFAFIGFCFGAAENAAAYVFVLFYTSWIVFFRLRHQTSSRWGARVIRWERRACCWEGRRQLGWMEALGLVGGKVWVWVRVAEVGVGVCRGGIRWVI